MARAALCFRRFDGHVVGRQLPSGPSHPSDLGQCFAAGLMGLAQFVGARFDCSSGLEIGR